MSTVPPHAPSAPPAPKSVRPSEISAASVPVMLPWRRRRALFLKVVSLGLLGVGLWEWSVALGLSTIGGKSFLELRGPVRNALAAFGVADLVAAVGLWLGANWGPVLLIVDVAISVMLHSVYSDIHGSSPIGNVVWLVVVAAVVFLSLMVRMENHRADELRRKLRKEARGNN